MKIEIDRIVNKDRTKKGSRKCDSDSECEENRNIGVGGLVAGCCVLGTSVGRMLYYPVYEISDISNYIVVGAHSDQIIDKYLQ